MITNCCSNVRFGSIADIGASFCDVRFVPEADIHSATQNSNWVMEDGVAQRLTGY
jgi:hypothetical protein